MHRLAPVAWDTAHDAAAAAAGLGGAVTNVSYTCGFFLKLPPRIASDKWGKLMLSNSRQKMSAFLKMQRGANMYKIMALNPGRTLEHRCFRTDIMIYCRARIGTCQNFNNSSRFSQVGKWYFLVFSYLLSTAVLLILCLILSSFNPWDIGYFFL